jgi:hypothetical protein
MGRPANRVDKPRIGVFGIGLAAYWEQAEQAKSASCRETLQRE